MASFITEAVTTITPIRSKKTHNDVYLCITTFTDRENGFTFNVERREFQYYSDIAEYVWEMLGKYAAYRIYEGEEFCNAEKWYTETFLL